MILDTSFIVDLLRGNKKAIDKIAEFENKNEHVSTTTISVFEIWQGLPKKSRENQIEKTRELFQSINILKFDLESAVKAGEIHRKLKLNGKVIDPEDSMIAGIAKTHNEIVLTRNQKHFSRIKDLKIEIY